MAGTMWAPPAELSRDEVVALSEKVLGMPDREVVQCENVYRINALDLEWDLVGRVYEPKDAATIATGADGKKAGVLLIHGGGGDHRTQEPMGLLLARKFGFKVASMSFPGNVYLHDESRDWPGDTLYPDGTARTPIYHRDVQITPEQYEIVQDRSDPIFRAKYGTLFFLQAKEGTDFYHRLASWPAALEEGLK